MGRPHTKPQLVVLVVVVVVALAFRSNEPTHALPRHLTPQPDLHTRERLPPCTQAADEYDWEALRSWLRGISPPLSALAALQLFAQSAEACSRLHVEVVDEEGTV